MRDTKAMSRNTGRVELLDSLRGLASLSVCIFHIFCGNSALLPAGIVKSIAGFGYLGVEVFFVISGFILPYSMLRSQYRLRSDYWRFLARRLIRLEPPYLCTILLIIILNLLAARTPGFAGAHFTVDWPQLLAHLAYLNAFLELGWLNTVFWTLAIEFQFYLLIGLCFPLLVSPKRIWRRVFLSILFLLPFVSGNANFIFSHLHYFLLGMVTFLFHRKIESTAFLVCCLLLVLSPARGFTSFLEISTGVCAAVAIAAFASKRLPFQFLGMISYSLYLIHIPVGGKIVNLGSRFVTDYYLRLGLAVFAVGVCIAISYLFYRFIEEPAKRWSVKISYSR